MIDSTLSMVPVTIGSAACTYACRAAAGKRQTYVSFNPTKGARRTPIQVMRGPYMALGCTIGLSDCMCSGTVPVCYIVSQ